MIASVAALLPSVVWTLLSGTAYTIGDILLRVWFATPFRNGFLLVGIIYMSGTACMMMSFFEQNIALATVAAIVVNVILYLLASYLIYGDTVSVWQCTGLALGLIALAILELN